MAMVSSGAWRESDQMAEGVNGNEMAMEVCRGVVNAR